MGDNGVTKIRVVKRGAMQRCATRKNQKGRLRIVLKVLYEARGGV